MMEQRNRIARALANTDISGPEDFDLADEYERNMYDRMALAALNAQHVYAVHTVAAPDMFAALVTVPGEMTVTVGTDQYEEWGEEAGQGHPRHVLIGVDTIEEAREVARALNVHNLPADVTDHADWSVTHQAEETYSWATWMRDSSRFGTW